MKHCFRIAVSLVFLIIFVMINSLNAKTTVSTTGDFTPSGVFNITDQFDEILKKNGKAIANAMALTNLTGYPIGVASLGTFPAFFVGVVAGAGFSNMEYFDKDKKPEQGLIPVAGLNPLLVFGFGLSKNFDFIGKVFVYSDDFYLPEFSYKGLDLNQFSFYSFGAKARYTIFKGKNIIPGLLTFGGLGISIGADFLYGIIGFEGDKPYPLDSIEVDPGTGPVEVDLYFQPNIDARVEWYTVSIVPELLAYFNILWIFNFYTGFGFPLNFGSFDIDIRANGDAIVSSPPALEGTNAGSITIVSTNKYQPMVFMPVLVIGLELALWKVFLSYETMVNLVNISDVNMQFGFRIQI